MPSAGPHKGASFWVEISSPTLHRSSKSISSSALKENSKAAAQPAKRKLSLQNSDPTSKKKPKLSHLSTNVQCLASSEEFPNGYFYCHQCNKRRDGSVGIQCTFKDDAEESSDSKESKARRCCTVKFCRMCLKNRYGQDMEDIMNKARSSSGHVQKENLVFKCPKCEGICNCARCRKSQGLEPTGNLTFVVRRSGGESVAQALAGNINLTGIVPGKGAQKQNFPAPVVEKSEPAPSTSRSTKEPKDTLSSKARKKEKVDESGSAPKPKVRAKPKPKPRKVAPPLHWHEVPTSLSIEQAQDRIHIREFMLRFACIMQPPVAKSHLDELEELAGASGSASDDRHCPEWVSDMCLKSILLGVLGLFTSEDEDTKPLKVALKDMRSAGANLSKIWSIIFALRAELLADRDNHDEEDEDEEDENPLTKLFSELPDPLYPPLNAYVRSTRSTAESGIPIVSSAQLIPILSYLIERSLETDTIREEIGEGVQEGKDDLKEVRECIKKEKDRWDALRTELEDSKGKGKEVDGELKTKRNEHKKAMSNLEFAGTLMQYDFVPRYSGLLGQDSEKRVYFVLTPGQAERLEAVDFVKNTLAGRKEKAKPKGRGRDKWSEEERSKLRDWSWFVAVWGKKPDDALPIPRPALPHDDGGGADDVSSLSELEEDEDSERWWGFHAPEEIKKLARWVGTKAGLEDLAEGETGDRQAKSLVDGLKSFADLLEWRITREVKFTGLHT